ncbi:MAG: YgiQ family radical SAM protein [Oscillospiraceae bacterium]|nr:YgiQ family radical SAM protein [Oscillospiraceae bacterium]
MIFQASAGREADFLLITGDEWADHPAFGAAVIARVLEAEDFSVAYLSRPQWKGVPPLDGIPRPRLAGLVTAGSLDSMVANYTAAKKRRAEGGHIPDRACIVYTGLLKTAFPGLPVILGGLEASLRRFAHYDYWEDKVRRPMLMDTGADALVYGMGERAVRELARQLSKGEPLYTRGVCVMADKAPQDAVMLPSFETVAKDRRAYAKAVMLEHREHDPVRGRTLCQPAGKKFLVCAPPALPLTTAELDFAAELPFTREPAVKAAEEVRFSLIHNRGCFGGCNFCSLAFHQGRTVTARSHASLLREAEGLTKLPGFKGYIHDVGGPTANFRRPACKKQTQSGSCADRQCLTPKPCPALDASHEDYLALLRKLRALPGVKKVFIRSGIRYDFLLLDQSGRFMEELVSHHISGQLKVAPEHCQDHVLDLMGKPRFSAFRAFAKRYETQNLKAGKKQFLVPYLISSHPGSRLEDAVELALTLKKMGRRPEQVQDFYPTPGTISTCMYHTGLDPRTMKPVFTAKSPHEKAMQRALLQWFLPQNRKLAAEGLRLAGRPDLIPVLLGPFKRVKRK